jgi:transcriptional regulator with XRE-family HTH domain
MQVVKLTGVSGTTIHCLEHDSRRPQTRTLEKLLNLYALRITRLERMEHVWGEDGLKNKPVRQGDYHAR